MTIRNQQSEERDDYEVFKSGIRGLSVRTDDVQEHMDLLRKKQTKVAHGLNADLDTIQDIKEKVQALTNRLNGLEKDCNWSRDFLVEGCRTAERTAVGAGQTVTSDDDVAGGFRARRKEERDEKAESGARDELQRQEDDEEYAENLARDVIREGGQEASDELYAADDKYRKEMEDDEDYRREAEHRGDDDLDIDERRYEAASEEEEEANRDRQDSLADDDLDEGKYATHDALSDEEPRDRLPSGESLGDDDGYERSRDDRYDDEQYSDEEVLRRAEDDERYSDEMEEET